MMTQLTKPVRRLTTDTVFDRGRERPLVVELVPPNMVCVRIKGTQSVTSFSASNLFWQRVTAPLLRARPHHKDGTVERGSRF
jgi:hypothetical protein